VTTWKTRATRPPLPEKVRTCSIAGAVFLTAWMGVAAVGVAAQETHGDHPSGDRSRTTAPVAVAGHGAADLSIDGRLDDAAWAKASVITGFVQGEPVEGIPAEEETEVRVLLDGDALYVGARMHDARPDEIGTRLERRDERGSFDWFRVSLDPNRDGLTGYSFQVSAAGVQRDAYLYNDEREDDAWDAVWASEVAVDDAGWTAEIRIPLSQIRYESGEGGGEQAWGVNFSRRRLSSNELSYFALKSRAREGRVSQFGRLEQVRVPGSSRRIEVRPYLLSSFHNGPSAEGDPFFDGDEASARTGLDLSLGIGSAFSLDATVNPDFGQVEADPAVINLSAFETFFQERRPFFVEDAQVLDFSLSGFRNQLYYSRRIGRSPRGRAPLGSDFEEIPDAATIVGAAKFTGRTSGGLSIGALTAVTDEERGRAYFEDDDLFQDFRVEPRTEYGVVRLQQDFGGGTTQVGGIVTALHRDITDEGDFDFLPDQAYSAGVDFEHQWSDREWALSGFVAGSHVLGDSTAILRIQRSSNHYFQRPDATRLEVDSAATSISGAQWRLRLAKQSGRHWTGSMWVGELIPGFEVNDLGFNTDREGFDLGARIRYGEIEPTDLFRSYDLTFSTTHKWIHEALDAPLSGSLGDAYESGSYRLDTSWTLHNFWRLEAKGSFAPDHWSFDKTRGGPTMLDPGSWHVEGQVNTDGRQPVSLGTGFNYREQLRDAGQNLTLWSRVAMRPTPQLELEVRPRLTTQRVADQYVTSTGVLPFEPTFGRRYFFGDLERRSFSLETRVNWTFSPDLSLQLFAQPLLSSGDYTAYQQLAAARTFDFVRFDEGEAVVTADGIRCSGGSICLTSDGRQHVDLDGDGATDVDFRDRDFNVRSLVGNAVLRWEYRPGSTIFLVWQRSQLDRSTVGDFDLGRDAGALFDAPADDRFIVKVNYWLGL